MSKICKFYEHMLKTVEFLTMLLLNYTLFYIAFELETSLDIRK